jgi:hypothetical protein
VVARKLLVNNIAWLLRRLPLFLLPDGGRRDRPRCLPDRRQKRAEDGSGHANTYLPVAFRM